MLTVYFSLKIGLGVHTTLKSSYAVFSDILIDQLNAIYVGNFIRSSYFGLHLTDVVKYMLNLLLKFQGLYDMNIEVLGLPLLPWDPPALCDTIKAR